MAAAVAGDWRASASASASASSSAARGCAQPLPNPQRPHTRPASPAHRRNYSAHGVNSAQSLKSGAVVYRMSGSRSAAQSSFDRLVVLDKYHGAPTGVFQADETLSDSMPSHGTELCAVVESIFSLNIVHEIQGDASFADRAERIAYNALPGTCVLSGARSRPRREQLRRPC